jgi:hypothetical protein
LVTLNGTACVAASLDWVVVDVKSPQLVTLQSQLNGTAQRAAAATIIGPSGAASLAGGCDVDVRAYASSYCAPKACKPTTRAAMVQLGYNASAADVSSVTDVVQLGSISCVTVSSCSINT